jgi:uncharacterized protein YndB with AHSA1/START domain
MSTTSLVIPATPDEVFAVLADPYTYTEWVVGAHDIRHVEGTWPDVGSHFFHTVGVGPIKTKDNTKVIEVEPGKRLVLEARARPAGVARVIFDLRPVEHGTEVEIEEYPINGPAKAFHNPIQDGVIKVRNVETLRRLERVVIERRSAA